ncbi:hypothetical protein AAT19DRAFT_13973 [Rhodotorula toruloides]|uniref:Uncharacterized protein n=1 Tax=Rhodotorula toruloides TaxID=5286 RepID=A0A2T0AAB3_RHOTO|nr:hypothetical protein AAT19DRAFT_13973 [Rhodotorula toruloides]
MPAVLLRRDNDDDSSGKHIVGIWPAFIGIAALVILGGLLLRWICVRRARKDFRPLYNSGHPVPAPISAPVAYTPAYPPAYPPPAHPSPSQPADSPLLAPAPPSPALPPEPASPGCSRLPPEGHSVQRPDETATEAGETARRVPGLTLEQGSLFAATGAPGAGLAPPPYSPSVRGIGSDIRGM